MPPIPPILLLRPILPMAPSQPTLSMPLIPPLILMPGPAYRNLEYFITEEKDILFIWYYTNNPNDLHSRDQLTWKHLAAIKKAQLIKEDPKEYEKLKINPQDFGTKAFLLIDLVEDINHYDKEYSDSVAGLRVTGNKDRVDYILDSLRGKFPHIKAQHVVGGYRLGKFLDLLKGGLFYEDDCLNHIKGKYALVPANIKQEFELQAL